MLAKKGLDAAREVVHVPRLLDTSNRRADIPPAVARVEHERDSRQVRGAHPVDELLGLEPRLVFLDASRVVRRAKLRREVFERNLDGEVGGDRAHVLDAAPRGDLRGLGRHVLGVQPAGEPDDD